MSILIKGAEMPRHCGYCFFNDFNICQIEHFTVADAVYHEERHEGCPLVEIPPHGRLIDADEMEAIIRGYAKDQSSKYKKELFEGIADIVRAAETVMESEEQEHESEDKE